MNIIEESPNFQLEIASSPKKLEVENNKIELEETKEISKNDINEIEEKIDEEIGNYEKITNLEILDTNNGLFSKIQKNEENEKIECVEKIQIQPIIEIKEQTQINSVEKIIKKDQTSEFNLTLTAILNKIVDEESEIKLERIEDKKNEYTINENSNSFCLNQNLENSKEFIVFLKKIFTELYF